MALLIGHHKPGEFFDYAHGVTDSGDQIVGNDGNDHIYAGKGDDIIKGGGGADYIDGGAGRDGATYDDSNVGVDVNLVTGKGHGGTAEGDTLVNIEDLYGSKYDDHLTGNSQNNLLRGSDGNDTLKGGGGADVLYGDAGNDVLVIDGVEDHAHGGDGIDTLVVSSKVGLVINLASGYIDANPYTSPGDWYNNPHFNPYGPFGPGGPFPHAPGDTPQVTDIENVIGSNFSDKIIGTDGANSLFGQDGDDVLMGRAGDDHLDGGNGNDFLFGGTGADTLTGGQGADMWVWTAVNDSLMAGGKPQDIVTDFQPGSDKIDLHALNLSVNDLIEIDNQSIEGANYAYVGVDANHNGQLDEGEFAIAVKMAPGTVLHANDFLF